MTFAATIPAPAEPPFPEATGSPGAVCAPPPRAGRRALGELASLGDASVRFAPARGEFEPARRAFERLMHFLAAHPAKRIYGIHTYYGADIEDPRDPADWRRQQAELLRYLHVGVGEPLPAQVVRRALRIQAMKSLRGYSAIHPDTIRGLADLSNGAALPDVPRYGSLGASGDLVPMAHAIAPVIEAGGVRGPRDVLGLVNTNSMMSALAVELFGEVQALFARTCRATGLASLALGLDEEFCAGGTLAINPAHGRNREAGDMIARARRRFLARQGKDFQPDAENAPQPRYSIRCAPQVLGNAMAQLDFAAERIAAEALSVSDNPIIDAGGTGTAGEGDIAIAHGGLFYTAGLATAADQMLDVACKCAEMLNRQTFLLVDPRESGGLPRNLECAPGDHVKGIHQLVNALEQSLRAGGTAARNMTSPAEGYNQDIVPGSMAALLNLQERIDIAHELTRGASFIAERGALLRLRQPVPGRLALAAWADFAMPGA